MVIVQLFVVGHDCGHRSFSKNKLVEDIVGTLMFMPLIYPFEPWRIKHNHHHAHTNKCATTAPLNLQQCSGSHMRASISMQNTNPYTVIKLMAAAPLHTPEQPIGCCICSIHKFEVHKQRAPC